MRFYYEHTEVKKKMHYMCKTRVSDHPDDSFQTQTLDTDISSDDSIHRCTTKAWESVSRDLSLIDSGHVFEKNEVRLHT